VDLWYKIGHDQGYSSSNEELAWQQQNEWCSALDFNSLILIYLFDNIIQEFSFKGFMVLWSVVTR
jgi:hypothetical protein